MSSIFPANKYFLLVIFFSAFSNLSKVSISPKTEAVSAKVSGVFDKISPCLDAST